MMRTDTKIKIIECGWVALALASLCVLLALLCSGCGDPQVTQLRVVYRTNAVEYRTVITNCIRIGEPDYAACRQCGLLAFRKDMKAIEVRGNFAVKEELYCKLHSPKFDIKDASGFTVKFLMKSQELEVDEGGQTPRLKESIWLTNSWPTLSATNPIMWFIATNQSVFLTNTVR